MDASFLASMIQDKKDEQRRKQAAFVQAVPAIWQIGTGIVQKRRAKKIEKAAGERPEWTISPAYQKAMEQAQMIASQRELPGQSIMENKIAGQTAAGVEQLKGASTNQADIIAGVTGLYANQMQQGADLDVMAAQNFANNQSNLYNAYQTYGGLQQEYRQKNVIDPYERAMAAASALREGAMMNTKSGIQGLSNAFSNYLTGKQDAVNPQMMQSMMGQGATGNLSTNAPSSLSTSSGINTMSPKPSYVNTPGIGSMLYPKSNP